MTVDDRSKICLGLAESHGEITQAPREHWQNITYAPLFYCPVPVFTFIFKKEKLAKENQLHNE